VFLRTGWGEHRQYQNRPVEEEFHCNLNPLYFTGMRIRSGSVVWRLAALMPPLYRDLSKDDGRGK
jgi:hypothetical protein